MWTAKTLIRLGRCPGWSESLLGAHAILLVLSWGGSFEYSSYSLSFMPHVQTIPLWPSKGLCMKKKYDSYTLFWCRNFFIFQVPLIGVPFRYLAVVGSVIPSAIFMMNTTQIILQGGVGKNKSTVAVSMRVVKKICGLSLSQHMF